MSYHFTGIRQLERSLAVTVLYTAFLLQCCVFLPCLATVWWPDSCHVLQFFLILSRVDFCMVHCYYKVLSTFECLILPYLFPANIFYLMEFREIFLTLLRKFDERMQPRSFLRDLVESTHLFLRMLERFCKGRNNLLVQVSTTRVGNSGENSLA